MRVNQVKRRSKVGLHLIVHICNFGIKCRPMMNKIDIFGGRWLAICSCILALALSFFLASCASKKSQAENYSSPHVTISISSSEKVR
jgi:hypothetical protein